MFGCRVIEDGFELTTILGSCRLANAPNTLKAFHQLTTFVVVWRRCNVSFTLRGELVADDFVQPPEAVLISLMIPMGMSP